MVNGWLQRVHRRIPGNRHKGSWEKKKETLNSECLRDKRLKDTRRMTGDQRFQSRLTKGRDMCEFKYLKYIKRSVLGAESVHFSSYTLSFMRGRT